MMRQSTGSHCLEGASTQSKPEQGWAVLTASLLELLATCWAAMRFNQYNGHH